MTLGLASATRDAFATSLNTSAGTSAKIRIYSSPKPTTGGAVGAAVQLAELTGNATAFGTVSAGVLTVNAITGDAAADATGTAFWFRVVKSDGTTFAFDGDVSTTGSDLNLNTTAIVAGATVNITSFSFTMPNP